MNHGEVRKILKQLRQALNGVNDSIENLMKDVRAVDEQLKKLEEAQIIADVARSGQGRSEY